MLKEISLKDALLAFAGHRDVIVLDIADADDVIRVAKFSDMISILSDSKYRFLLDEDLPTSLADALSTGTVEGATPQSTKPEAPVNKKARPERKKVPEVVKKREPKEEEPFDYGKLGALIRAGKPIEFLQQEFGCTRAQIAARIRIWNKMEEEKNGRADTDTEQSDNG